MARKLFVSLLFLLMAGVICPTGAAPAQPEESEEIEKPPVPQKESPEAPLKPPPKPPERRVAPSPPRGDTVSLNFRRADLIEIIHVLAQHLKLNYIIDPDVKGTVTIHSSVPIKREDLLPIFHHILRMNGAVLVKTRDFYRIAPMKEGKGLARPFQGKQDSYALEVVPVRFFSAAEMKRLLTPFVSPGGDISDYPRGNFLIITDIPTNIERLLEIKDLIDVNVLSGVRMEIYQPKVASAEELAGEMTKIMQAYASSALQAEGFAAQFIPVPRINQILVISHSDPAWTYVQQWLKQLDTGAEGPGRRVFVYPVENGKATELADVLNEVLGRPSTVRKEPPRTLRDIHDVTPRTPRTLPGMRPTSPGAPSVQVPPLGAYAAAPAEPPKPAAPPPPTPPPAIPSPPAPKPDPKVEEQLRIVADPATNSLIIYGTAQEFQNIKNILKELDLMPRQVLLDVVVAEVSLADDLSLGVEFEIRRKGGDVRIFDREFGSRGAIRSGILPAIPTGGGLTPFGSGISAVVGTTDNVRAFINALMTDSRVKVLSSPTVLATDNRPARIQVGNEIPILSSQQVTPTTTGILVNNVQYRNTGVILTIVPQVNSQGLVNLQIKQEVSDVGVENFGATGSPSFTTRDAETTAVVQDGDSLVIGGIITERKSRGRTGIPYLMDIPVIGRFFGATSDSTDRTELVILLTPRVIRNDQEARSATDEFKQRLSTATREIERMQKPKEEERVSPEKSSSPPSNMDQEE